MKNPEKYRKYLQYIDKYWKKSTFYSPKDTGIHIGLPEPFVAPNGTRFGDDQFYWDSYFIILGLVESGKIKLAKGMVDNLVYLFGKFGIVPSRNRYYNLGISQIPFLTSMIMAVFGKTNDTQWLRKTVKTAEKELELYWMNGYEKRGEIHLVHRGLSRYCDHYVMHKTSEHESGWDMTSRFGDRCLDYLPIDLNSCLYKYEKDISKISGILGNRNKEIMYSKKAEKRKKIMNSLMWNEKKGFFFDYNYMDRKQSGFYSVAGFYPLWSGLAEKEQARRVEKNLKKFEYAGGIANTQKTGLSKEFRQHDYPNGWANQQWIVIKGLSDYGFEEDARRLSMKWIEMNIEVFRRTGKFWEKYNVVKRDVGKEGRYPNQTGFGWTNAVFVKLAKKFL